MQFGGWCYVCPPDIDERVAETVEEAVKQGKPDWCPLVEIVGDDVAPVVHGHWCEDEFDVWCSNCFCVYPKDETGIADWRKMSKYCDNCGAEMDEEM